MLINIAIVDLKNNLGILVHLLMRLSNDESILAATTEHKELDGFLLRALKLTVIGNHVSTLRKLALLTEDLLRTIRVVEVIQVETNDILPVIGLLVRFLSLMVVLLGLLGLSYENKDSR